MSFSTPILFLVFNRPDTTRRVFDVLKVIKPSRLFVCADGPREGNTNDMVCCEEVRKIVSSVDWPCQLMHRFSSQNLGCKTAVSQSISWFFQHVEEGIVLEDDTLPHPSFFHFCASMLNKYRGDERVMHISGFNLLGKWKGGSQSYHFSSFGTVWGWATWRRSWEHYDVDIIGWESDIVKEKILSVFPISYRESRRMLYDSLYQGEIDTWDYQWTFCRLLRNGLSIVPAKNLIENIGFDERGTHTHQKPSWLPDCVFVLQSPFVYRGSVKVDQEFETKYLEVSNGIGQADLSKSSYFNSAMRFVAAIFFRLKHTLERLK